MKQLSPVVAKDPNPLQEIGELAVSAGALVCAELVSSRSRPVAATFIGKGIVEQLAEKVAQHGATLVIFDHALSPIQERNLELAIGCRVLDRAGLILDIFAQRATSSEGKLQVELAQLKHLSTRLVRGWTHLERQKGGIGLRGPGETQLETDRRLIGMRIKTLTRRLEKVEAQRGLRRRARHRTPIPTVSLVGYTNAGKSSLFNALTGDKVYAADQLFATLDPTMRRLDLPGFGPIVLSDTVGFVRDLPHTLVAAFHSTLEEVCTATCLVLVNDVSDPEHLELKLEVEKVLDEIGAADVPRILVNNKIDLTGESARITTNGDAQMDKVWLSAESGEGIELIQQALATLLGRQHHEYLLKLQPGSGEIRASLYRRCDVIEESSDASGNIIITVRMAPADRGWLESKWPEGGLWQELSNSAAGTIETANLVLSE